MYEVLSMSPIFRGLKPDELKEVLAKSEFYVKHYKKDEVIGFRDQPYETLMIVLEGKVSGEMQDFNGKTINIEEMEPPSILAPAFLFGSSNRLPVDIIAKLDTKIFCIPKKSVISLMQLNVLILKNYLDRISDKANFLSNKLWFISFKTIKEKYVHYILSLDKKKENRITCPKSQTELALFFGVTRPSLARVIGDLSNEGIIEVSGKEVIIKNREALIELLNE